MFNTPLPILLGENLITLVFFIIMLEFAIKSILSLWHCMVVVTSDALSLELKAELKIFLYVNLPFINKDYLHVLDGVYHYHETFVIVLSVILCVAILIVWSILLSALLMFM